jgi:hypothetical protein
MRNTYLSKWYWKVKQRRGGKRAIVALARKIMVIIYNMLKNGSNYDEDSFELTRIKQEKVRVKRIIAEARRLGLEVINPSQTA